MCMIRRRFGQDRGEIIFLPLPFTFFIKFDIVASARFKKREMFPRVSPQFLEVTVVQWNHECAGNRPIDRVNDANYMRILDPLTPTL